MKLQKSIIIAILFFWSSNLLAQNPPRPTFSVVRPSGAPGGMPTMPPGMVDPSMMNNNAPNTQQPQSQMQQQMGAPTQPQMQQPQIPNPPISPTSAQIVPVTTDSRIKTLVYNANEVYQLKFHYGYQSFIEFSESEEIEMISIGESFAWRLTPAGKRLFVRPLEIGAHTNMTIITNRRTYQFDIASTEYDGRADEELVYTVRFYYPEIGVTLPIPPRLSSPNVPPGSKAAPSRPIVKAPIPTQYVDKYLTQEITKNEEGLNFKYSIAGRSNNITPLKVYDDGRETFFQFKDKNLIVPSISTVDIFGNERPVGYAIREGFVVVQGTYTQLTLRLADSLLCIFNEQVAARPQTARTDFYQKEFPKSTKP